MGKSFCWFSYINGACAVSVDNKKITFLSTKNRYLAQNRFCTAFQLSIAEIQYQQELQPFKNKYCRILFFINCLKTLPRADFSV